MQLSKHFPDNVPCKCVTLHPSNTVPTGRHRHAHIATVFVWKKTQQTIFRFIVNKMPRQERTGFEIFDVRYKPQQNVLLVVWCFSVCLFGGFPYLLRELGSGQELILMWAFSVDNLDWTWYCVFLFRSTGTWIHYRQATSTTVTSMWIFLEEKQTSIPVSFSVTIAKG